MYWAIMKSYSFSDEIALSSPCAIALSTSLLSDDIPESANNPERLFNISSIWAGFIFSLDIKYVTTDGSKSPEREPIATPPNGVSPIVVSTLTPFWMAHRLTPWPIWQFIIFSSSIGFPSNFAISNETYLWDVPWNPYFLIPYFS